MFLSKGFIRSLMIIAATAASYVPASAQSCSGTTTVTCTGAAGASVHPGSNAWTAASVYPTSYTISGVSGTVSSATGNVKLVLHGLFADGTSFTCMGNNAMMLVSPDNRTFEFMFEPGSQNCQGGGTKLNTITLNIADTNSNAMPTAANDWPTLSGPVAVRPGAGYTTGQGTYPSPSPFAHAANEPAPESPAATFLSVFGGAMVNGTWKLFMVDQGQGDTVSFTSWDLILDVSATSVSTATSLSSNTPGPAVTGTAVTYTATVGAATAPTGSVTFTDTLPGGSPVTLCSAVVLAAASGTTSTAACSPSIASEGNHLITASYTPTGSFATSSGTLSETYRKATTVSGLQFCNSGTIGIPGVPANQPIYPSYVNVTGVANSVATLTVQLKGLQATTSLGSVQMMLVAPSGQALEFLSDAGPTVGGQPAVNVTFADSNPSAPQSTLSSTTYEGTSYTTGDTYPAPAPASFLNSQPGGGASAKTFQQAFSGATSNGNWQLFVRDNGGTGSAASLAGGWCISLTTNSGANTTTTLNATPNPTTTGTAVTFNTGVTSSSTVNAGTVSFTENGAAVAGGPGSPVAVSPTGTAGFATTSLTEGDHAVLAAYSGVPGTFNPSFASVVERVNNVPTVSGTNPFVYCNTGAIAIPATDLPPNDIGAGFPNPSNMLVTSLPGTINAVTLTLKGYHATVPNAISSLLVGPSATNGQSFDFFSGVGGNSIPFGPGDLTFSDAAGSLLSGSPFAAGTYKPTSLTSNDTFTASPSGFYTLPPGPYQYAATSGTSTFTSLYHNLLGNGTWSLYFNQNTHETAGGVNGGWCLNFTQTLPDITVTASHSGTFKRGGTAAIGVTVHNAGPGPTGGTITVTDNLPAGLAASNFANATSAGWTCSGTTTVTCTSASAISAASTSPFSFDVSVGNSSADSITNSGSVAGGGDGNTGNNTFSDGPFSVFGTNLTVNKTHTDPFAQGQTGDTYTITVKNTGALGTSTGPGVTTGSVVVTDNLPSGLTATGFAGSGWTCNSLPALMCTLNSPLAVGASASVTLTVTVSSTAAAQVTNTAVLNDSTDQIGTDPVSHADLTNITQVATHYSVSAPGTATAGTAISVTVTALDAANNTVTGYSGTAHFTSSDGAATLPANSTLTNGTGTFSVTLHTAGGQTITATDTVNSSITGTTGTINVAASTVQLTVTTNINGPTVTVDGGTAFTGTQNFTFTIGSSHTIATTSPQTSGSTQFVWMNWSDSGAISHSLIVPSTTTTYTANFKTQFLLTTSVAPLSGAGSIAPPTGFVDAGSVVSVSATLNAGYVFTGFSGGLTGTTNPQNMTVNGATSVVANFTEDTTGILAQISAKSGPQNARAWTVTFTNNGPGAADNIMITGFTLTQQGGAACTPVGPSGLPLNAGRAGPGAQVSSSVTLDFTGCAANARFKLVMPFTANSGAASGTLTLGNQFQ